MPATSNTPSTSQPSYWIWCVVECARRNPVVCFRKTFDLPQEFGDCRVRVSADSRYRLYVNGQSVTVGPCKGDRWYTYYEELDLKPYLQAGPNVVAARVVHFTPHQPFRPGWDGPTALMGRTQGAFLLDGGVDSSAGGELVSLSTNTSWKAVPDGSRKMVFPRHAHYAGCSEHFLGDQHPDNWEQTGFSDQHWQQAIVVADSELSPTNSTLFGQTNTWNLTARPIPLLFEQDCEFVAVTNTSELAEGVRSVLKKDGAKLSLPPRTQAFFELDAGELQTGYLCLRYNQGAGAQIAVTYSECYEQYDPASGQYHKGLRTDCSGVLRGETDLVKPSGRRQTFEPFWFRTFRYVRVEVTTAECPLDIEQIAYRATGYPLDVVGQYCSSDPSHELLWSISQRTLLRCMHETYEDCPFYEQLQYIQDTRLEALFTYQISADDRLPRRAIHDFHASLTPDGILQSRYPSAIPQIIPGFALHWIYMVGDHYQYFGDRDLVCRYRPTIDAVLDWFDRLITPEGIVGPTGYWAFIDWVEGWDQSSVPPAHRHGPITVHSMMYVSALQIAAGLLEATGRLDTAAEYRRRAQSVAQAVRETCWDDEQGLFRDGPNVREFCQHTQIWAVLAEVVEGEAALRLIKHTLESDLPRASYVMSFFLFRALEKVGLYQQTEQLWDTWRTLADQQLTTWVEDPVTQRSECHGWGSLPLFEFPARVLGVTPAEPGYQRVQIAPSPGSLEWARGVVATCQGPVAVEWKHTGGEFEISVTLPDNLPSRLCLPNGEVVEHAEKSYRASCQWR